MTYNKAAITKLIRSTLNAHGVGGDAITQERFGNLTQALWQLVHGTKLAAEIAAIESCRETRHARLMIAEAAEARHRRHLARLRWRASLPKDQTSCRIEPWQTDRLQRRSFLHPQPGYWRDEPSWSPHGDRWTGWVRSWTHGLFDPDVLDYWRRDASAVDIGGPFPGDSKRPAGVLP